MAPSPASLFATLTLDNYTAVMETSLLLLEHKLIPASGPLYFLFHLFHQIFPLMLGLFLNISSSESPSLTTITPNPSFSQFNLFLALSTI